MKQKLIYAAIAVAILIGIMLYVHYVPVWNSVANLISLCVGSIIGWVAHVLYLKLFKKEEDGKVF